MHAYFLWCVHYIKIFLFMSFFHLCALNCVLLKFLQFFTDMKFDIFPPWIHENNKILVLHEFQGEKHRSLNQEKNRWKFTFKIKSYFFNRTYYFGKRHDMKQCTTFKNHFWKTPAIWNTLTPQMFTWPSPLGFLTPTLNKLAPGLGIYINILRQISVRKPEKPLDNECVYLVAGIQIIS